MVDLEVSSSQNSKLYLSGEWENSYELPTRTSVRVNNAIKYFISLDLLLLGVYPINLFCLNAMLFFCIEDDGDLDLVDYDSKLHSGIELSVHKYDTINLLIFPADKHLASFSHSKPPILWQTYRCLLIYRFDIHAYAYLCLLLLRLRHCILLYPPLCGI